MDALVQSILVNAAVCLYAVFGFCLSVLASLLRLLGAKQAAPINIPQKRAAKPRLQPISPNCNGRPTTRILRICSDKSVLEHFPEKKAKGTALQNRKKLLASHRRSRSIPTLDYFADNLRHNSDAGNRPPTKPVRKPLTFVIPPTPERQPSQLPIVASQSEKPVFRLANLFSKEKENSHKSRERKISSPEAVQDAAKLAVPRQRRTSEGNKLPLSPTDNKPRKPMRRISSAPGTTEEKLTMKFDLTFTRSVEKKKSSTLRTQPYEAPFFCTPPTLPRRSISATDLTSNKKPSRSWTLKT